MKGRYYFMSLLAMIIAIFSLTTFTACKDNNEDEEWIKIYPSDENYEPFEIKNAIGVLQYSKEDKKWYLRLENREEVLNKNFGDESGAVIEIVNANDELKTYQGSVSVNGTIRLLYVMTPNNSSLPLVSYHYELTINSIQIYDKTNKTRAGGNDFLGCGTPNEVPPTWLFSRASNNALTFTEYNIRVYTHIVRSSSGEGLSKNITTSIINSLNDFYAGSNISFLYSGAEYIDNDTYNLMSDKDNATLSKYMKGLFSINSKQNAINVYVISDSRNLIATSGASFMYKNNLYVRANRYATSTVAHEVGHCLGLWHTHHGTDPRDGGTPEFVNGSNSTTAGDFVSDTPADPNKWYAGFYVGGDLTDANGDKYNPDPLNLMSYSGHDNRGKITPKQCEMMYNTIANQRALQMTCTTNTASISGPEIINSSATYSINVSDEYDVTWKITIETFTSKTASTKTSLTATGKSVVVKNPNVNATSQKYTITANIKNKKGVTFQQSKTAYHVIPSATTGTFKWSSELSGYPSYNKTGFLDPGRAGSYNNVSVYQNGDLYFYYTDVCGVNTYNNSYFNFVLNDNYSNFTKYTGGYHAYKCSRNAGTGSYTAILQVMAGSYSKLIPLNIQILQHPNPNGYDEEPKDSLEILKANKISKYIKRI